MQYSHYSFILLAPHKFGGVLCEMFISIMEACLFEKMLEMTIYGNLLSLRVPGMRLGE